MKSTLPALPAPQPHEDLVEIERDVYTVRGTYHFGLRVRIPRLMTILRTGDDLAIVNCIRLSPQGEAALLRLGQIKHLIKIGDFHSLDDEHYVRVLGAQRWLLPGMKSPTPGSDRELGDFASGACPIPGAELFQFQRALRPEGALLIRRAGGLLVTCDSLQYWPSYDGCSFLGRVMCKAMGFGGVSIGPGWRRLTEPRDGVGLEPDFARLLALDFQKLLPGHMAPLLDAAREHVVRAIHKQYPSLATQ